MTVHVHGKGMHVPEDLRALAEEKVSKAGRILDDADRVDVEFVEERNPRRSSARYRVEITARAAGHTVRAEAGAFEARAALDEAVDKYERQLRRLKERLVERNRRGGDKALNASVRAVEEEADRGTEIVRTKRFAMKPMTVEEAILEMEMLGHDFFFFLDADTGTYAVLYHRRDGTLGLIEPE